MTRRKARRLSRLANRINRQPRAQFTCVFVEAPDNADGVVDHDYFTGDCGGYMWFSVDRGRAAKHRRARARLEERALWLHRLRRYPKGAVWG